MPSPPAFRKNAGRLLRLLRLLKDTAVSWYNRDPFRNSTVVSYYTIFSLPGLLVIIIHLGGYFFGKERIAEVIYSYVREDISEQTARSIQTIVQSSDQLENITWSSLISIGTLLFGATGVFFQLQKSLNDVWGVEPKPNRMWLKFIKDRFFSFGLILAVGFLLLVSLILSTIVSMLSTWISTHLSSNLSVLFYLLDGGISLLSITALFAAIFKILPDVKIAWKDVWAGAVLTALMFVLAKLGLSYYFGQTRPASTYGAAGSIVLIMLWVNYSSMLVMFGAEFTRALSVERGSPAKLEEFAQKQDEPPSE